MADHAGQDHLDEAFLRALYEGSDLLGKNHLEEAREALQQAVDLRPGDPKAQNLLGLACFKLGDHTRALEIYAALIDDNPTDATLRVNLGLVYLKSGRYEEAIRELATATDLNPDHKRAQNYLGLAYARVGDYAQARECFAAAGSDQMVEKMERALAGEHFDGVAALGSHGPDGTAAETAASQTMQASEAAPAPVADEAPVPPAAAAEPLADGASAPEAAGPVEAAEPVEVDLGEAPEPPAEEAAADPFPEPEPEPDASPEAEAAPLPEAEPAPAEATPPAAFTMEPAEPVLSPEHFASPAPAPAAPRWRGARPLLEAAQLVSMDAAPAAPFAVGTDLVALRVDGELLSRARGLVAAEGHLAFASEVKRFRGRATDKPFGEGEERVLRITGDGRLFVATRGRRFTALELERADGYFREERVFAFEESVVYENGRVPSSVSPDLNLVHLRGTGAVLVDTAGPIQSLTAEADRPVRVPLSRLVGWHGPLTPRLLSFADEGGENDGPLVGVELDGEGVVLVALPSEG